MDILVSGGAGFIGTNFIEYILEKYPDYNIVCVDKLTYAGNKNNFANIEDNKRFHFCHADICNSNELLKIFKFWFGFDVIVNFAAESHVDRSISSDFSRNFIDSNIVGVFNLMEIIKKYKVKKFVQVSTDEVYGSLTDKGKFVETMNLKPSSLYSASKASADLISLSYFTTFQVPVVISRCSNNYGPYQFPEKFIPLMITNALEGKRLPIYGSGLNVRDWINVLDHCRALETLMHYGTPGEIYNSGGGNEAKNIDIAQFILDYLGLPSSMLEKVRDRPGHDFRYAMDYTKMKNEFGWKPKMEFKEGLVDTIEWYKSNENWWKPLKVIQ
jgi:dTDP-glucose 4,6-dehydratase